MDDLNATALELFRVGVAAADPADCVARAMGWVRAESPGRGGRWQVIALGKAAQAMTEAALAGLPRGTQALIVTTSGVAGAGGAWGKDCDLRIGEHPVPGTGSLRAGAAIAACLKALRTEDRCLALISGGGSALAVAPVPGVTLEDKAEVNRLLLGAGADITQMNLIRQQLSTLKGGGWLRLSEAPVTGLMLSDVPGDDLRVIASGPTVAPIGSRAEAAQLARGLGIWEHLPGSAQAALELEEEPQAPGEARNRLIGSNALSLAAMEEAGAQRGGFALEGDVRAMGPRLADALSAAPPGQPLVYGGETVVHLSGSGRGGRNQELALRVALEMETRRFAGDWVCLCAGTDGRDGPTDAAGGLVGPGTLARIRAAGISPEDALAQNDSNPALAAGLALVTVGETGTNVADLAVLIRGKA